MKDKIISGVISGIIVGLIILCVEYYFFREKPESVRVSTSKAEVISQPEAIAQPVPEIKPKPIPQAKANITKLRSQPRTLSEEDVRAMIKKYNFFCKKYDWAKEWYNESGNFENDFEDNRDGTISDHATGLMWQKSGSDDWVYLKDVAAYINELNRIRFAGYNAGDSPRLKNWRLCWSRKSSPMTSILTLYLTKNNDIAGVLISVGPAWRGASISTTVTSTGTTTTTMSVRFAPENVAYLII